MNSKFSTKISPNHLSRKAIVYLRQSSLGQVKHNTESQKLQYALEARAEELGFSQVEIIDTDLGVSAAPGARVRQGFKQLLADVALGKVGLILSREVSRLSRSDKDWCQLLELCRFYDTLIGDAEQIYDVNVLDDQFVLGIKGTLSVVELSVLKMRMQQGKESKAQRGELICTLTPGYVLDLDGGVIKDPDRRVQEAIGLLFRQFRQLGSLRKTHRWFHENGIEMPVNKSIGGRIRITWKRPSSSFVRDMVNNPFYAGAYTYGRRPIEVVVREGQPRKRQRGYIPPEEVKVLIKDHHEGYISWKTYEENRAMLKQNGSNFSADEGVQTARQGQGLLVGLLRCGRCGRKLQVRYWGSNGKQGRYLCPGTYQHGGDYCVGFGSTRVDQRISEAVLEVISPLGVKASLHAASILYRQENEKQRALQLHLQQLEYESQRAFEQYNRVDPANRLVADALEKRWNEKLLCVDELKRKLKSDRHHQVKITEQDKENLYVLGDNFAKVWCDSSSSMELKKRIVRLLIHEIIVNLDKDASLLQLTVHWKGGAHTRIEMPRPRSAAHAHKTAEQDVDLIRKMSIGYSDLEIARVLGSLGRKTGKGQRWTHKRVAYVRKRYQLERYDPNHLTDKLSLTEARKYLNVSDGTIKRLIESKILPANQVAPCAPLEIKRTDLESKMVKSIVKTLKRTGKLVIKGTTMAKQKSLFE